MKDIAGLLSKHAILIIGFIIVVLLAILIYIRLTRKDEGFYPLGEDRIALEESGHQRYNIFSDMTDALNPENIVPFGKPGQQVLNKVLQTGSYDYAANEQLKHGPVADIRFDNPSTMTPPPDNAELVRRIRLCESVKTWDCDAFNNPDFKKYCGICIQGGGGVDSKTKPFVFGGLYLDPKMRKEIEDDAREAKTKPEYGPTVGRCLPKKFILTRPSCDYRKDRWECAHAKNISDAYAIDKCVQCQNPPTGRDTFVYVGTRNGPSSNYSLNKKPYYFPIRLRLGMTMPKAKVSLIRSSNNEQLFPIIVSPIQIMFEIAKATENEAYTLIVEYESYKNYNFDSTDNDNLKTMISDFETKGGGTGSGVPGGGISVESASYGYNCNPSLKNNRLAFFQNKCNGQPSCNYTYNYTAAELPEPKDPAGGCGKTLEINYTLNGDSLSYIAPPEAGFGAQVKLGSGKLPIKATEGEKLQFRKAVCESTVGRVFTNNINNYTVAYGCGEGTCCELLPKISNRRYGVVGQFESMDNSRRTAPFDISIRSYNGAAVDPVSGPLRYGSLATNTTYKDWVKARNLPEIPSNRFWVWDADLTKVKTEFSIEIPVSFLESTFTKDANICPSGPVIQTSIATSRLFSGVCDKRVNGEPQGPGRYTKSCVQNMFEEAGCMRTGHGYPNTLAAFEYLTKTDDVNLDKSEIIDKVSEIKKRADTVYKSGMNVEKLEKDNLFCYGKFEFNPCNSEMISTGPQTVECLDFLFRNAGKTTTGIGPTYRQSSSRSSGSGRNITSPIMYCQRGGKLSPIGPDGKPNLIAINQANTLGSVENIRNYYDSLHKKANYSQDRAEQNKAMMDCYGIPIKRDTANNSGKGVVRYVRIYHTRNDYMQISQVVVLNSKNKNVALNKPVETSPQYQAETKGSNVVDGQIQMKHHQFTFCSQPSNAWLMINLLDDENVTEVTVYNRLDCCRERSVGQVVQLLNKNMKVLAERQMVGGDFERLTFDSQVGAPTNTIISNGTVIGLSPNLSPGSKVMNLLGDIVVQSDISKASALATQFRVQSLDNDVIQLITMSGPPKGGLIAVAGEFKIKVMEDDDTANFKSRSSWRLVDSVIGYPGEISLESVHYPGSYMYLNTVGKNITIHNGKDTDSKTKMSFTLL